jgi:selenophosphate synthase
MRELKTRVLSHMARSNIGIAEIIASYLPPRGRPFIPEKHITASKDISGEGLGALEDMALFSKVDIHLETLRLHASGTAKIQVRNNTANTNGAIVIAAHRKLAPRIMRDIKKTGSAPWIAGWVGNPSRSPKVYLKKSLSKYPFLRERPHDIFNRFVFT